MIWVHSHFHKDKKYKNKVTDEKVPFQLVQFKLIWLLNANHNATDFIWKKILNIYNYIDCEDDCD